MPEFVAPPGPDWVIAEMPAGYRIRLEEIQRLATDLQEMGKFARLLCAVGPELGEAVRDAFGVMKFDADLVQGPTLPLVVARLDGGKRLLLIASGSTDTVQKKSPELTEVFHLLQDSTEEGDRVVLVTNVDPTTPPASRAAALAPDALALLARMGAVHLNGPTLFNLWKVSHQALDKAREQVQQLHAADAETFDVPPSLLRLSELRL